MSKLFALVTAAALFSGMTAFAQDATPPAADTSAPAAAGTATEAAPTAMKKHAMHKSHGHARTMGARNHGTDWNADKLNACMANATPTASESACLKQASES